MALTRSPEFDGQTGRFIKGGREIKAHSYTRDPEVGQRLWDVSASLTGLDRQVEGWTALADGR